MWEGNVSTPTTLSTTASTAVASFVAAVITYPVESQRLKWAEEILHYWNHEEESTVHVNRNLRLFTPLVRLSFYEMARGFVSSSLTTTTPSTEIAKVYSSDIERQVLAGFIAGVSQTLLFTPFELWRTNQVMLQEEEYSSKWKNRLYSQVLGGGGSIDPKERRARAIGALSVKTGREVIFNVTFFPLFHMLRQHFRGTSPCGFFGKEDLFSLTASGIIAGSMCSALCTPMDIWIAHMMNSRERWSLWSGKTTSAVPLRILSRGLVLQACCFGPAFGAVAVVYELT
ncbi:unnamed protein product [Cylindrotheca closterium]|uniref:Mitochondrial carrier protein n=1 Tax=Cylindrotheca closterium TaxID=2856 RepID=A0AAD2GA68_9STRA|nr:unnamed protein product [Cylindrotheca closterium]